MNVCIVMKLAVSAVNSACRAMFSIMKHARPWTCNNLMSK